MNRLAGIQNMSAYLSYLRLRDNARYSDARRLANYELRVFSQNGEDGIMQHLISLLEGVPKYFLEIGVGDGAENNTLFLLKQGWSGVWFEGNARSCKKIRRRQAVDIKAGRLKLIEGMVEPGSINKIVDDVCRDVGVGVLSIDVDLDTHHIWSSIKSIRPAIAVIEYNASFPPSVEWEASYKKGRVWVSGVEYGASLKSLERIGKDKGYGLVGCDLCGVNAFFVRSDLLNEADFSFPCTALNHYEPPRYLIQPPGKLRF